jgi:hypothetical protein
VLYSTALLAATTVIACAVPGSLYLVYLLYLLCRHARPHEEKQKLLMSDFK